MENNISLEYLLKDVRGQLEFGERKNTYIFSFLTFIAVIMPFIETFTNLNMLLRISMSLFLLLYIIVILLILTALIPRMKDNQRKHIGDIRDDDKLIFFGDIAKYTFDEYKNALYKKYQLSSLPSAYVNDLISQILVNSKITKIKMDVFKKAILLSVFAILQFILCLLISLVCKMF